MTVGKKSPTKKSVAKSLPAKVLAARKSMPKEGKDPRGGLTDIGREWYARTQGAKLQPGVKGPADTPEKMRRKGSFLTRFFTNPRGPMVDKKGRPTRLALSAQAWGEPLPKTLAHAQALAVEGRRLLAQYHAVMEAETGTVRKRPARRKSKVDIEIW